MLSTKRVAYIGVTVTLAMAFSYLEVLIPFDFGIPGVKLGLANLVVLVTLYYLDAKTAFFINMIRILLTGFLFGNAMSMGYSVAGGLLSFLVMWLSSRGGRFSMIGVSLLGGIFHNIGQLCVAALVLETFRIAYYFPVLLISGLITGVLIGICAGQTLKRLPKHGIDLKKKK